MTTPHPQAAPAAWSDYRDRMVDLAGTLARAEDETGRQEQLREEAIVAARDRHGRAQADRDQILAQLPGLEDHAHAMLEQAGVAPEGAGAGDITAHVTGADSVRAVMAEIRSELASTTTALTAARAQADARRRGLITAAIITGATLATYVVLTALAANAFASLAATATVCSAGLITRRRGPVPATITLMLTLTAAVAAWLALHPLLTTILLLVAAATTVTVLVTRARRRSRRQNSIR